MKVLWIEIQKGIVAFALMGEFEGKKKTPLVERGYKKSRGGLPPVCTHGSRLIQFYLLST